MKMNQRLLSIEDLVGRLPNVIRLVVPLYVTLGVRAPKKWYLNLNNYRNTHFQVLNKTKVEYGKIVKDTLSKMGIAHLNRCAIFYELYLPTQRRTDVSNVCSIVDKYFSDVLVDLEILPDDDYTHLPTVMYNFGGVDKDNPRIDVYMLDLEEINLL